MTILTGRPLFLERMAATGSRYVVILAPNPPPISVGITFTMDSGRPVMAAVEERMAKAP